MRKIKMMVGVALSAGLLFTNCVKNEESDSVEALRMAQAGLYDAKAAAETTIADAEAAYRNGLAAVQNAIAAKETALAKIQEANARAKELANLLQEAKDADEIAKLEADRLTYLANAEAELIIAQNDIEIAKLDAQKKLAKADKELQLKLDEFAMEVFTAKNDDVNELWGEYLEVIRVVRWLRSEITELTYDIESDELALLNWDLRFDGAEGGDADVESDAYEFFTEEINEDIAELQADILDETTVLDELKADLAFVKDIIDGISDIEDAKLTVDQEIKTLAGEIADLQKDKADADYAVESYKDSETYMDAKDAYETAFNTKYGTQYYETESYMPEETYAELKRVYIEEWTYNNGSWTYTSGWEYRSYTEENSVELVDGDYSSASRIEALEQLIFETNDVIENYADANVGIAADKDARELDLEGYEAQLPIYQADYDAKLTVYNSKKAIFEDAEVEYDEAVATYNADPTTANQTLMNDAWTAMDDARDEMNDAKTEMDNAKGRLDGVNDDIAQAEHDIDDYTADMARNSFWIVANTTAIENINAEITAIETEIADVDDNIDALYDAYMVVEDALTALMDTSDDLQDQINAKNAIWTNKSKLQSDLDNTLYENNSWYVSTHETNIANKEADIDELEAEIAYLQKMLADDIIDRDEFDAMIQEKRDELAEKENGLTQRTEQSDAIMAEIEAILAELAE